MLRLALGVGADLRSTNRVGGTALIPACHEGHVETVRELLKTTIDIDSRQQRRLDAAAACETARRSRDRCDPGARGRALGHASPPG